MKKINNLSYESMSKDDMFLILQQSKHVEHCSSSKQVINEFIKVIDMEVESFCVAVFNMDFVLLDKIIVGGSKRQDCDLDVGYLIKRTLKIPGATQVLVLHNHPNSSIQPSPEDYNTTKRLLVAFSICGIDFVDSLIFNHNEYFSFKTKRPKLFQATTKKVNTIAKVFSK